jgi:hypothetical protein
MSMKLTPTSVWIWQPPAEGEVVPDYPPTDLTKFITGPIEFTDGTGDEQQRPIEQPGSSPAS